MLPVIGASAQTDESYDQFRQKMYSNYNGFRESILSDYAKFLDTAWKNMEVFRGKALFTKPKPREMPTAPKEDTTPPQVVPTPKTVPTPKPTIPEPTVTPPVVAPPVAPVQSTISFSLLTTTQKLPKVSLPSLSDFSERAVSNLWRQYQDKNVYAEVGGAIRQLNIGYNLGDWLTFLLVRRYSDALYPGDANSSIVFSHYLLVNMGYNVRLARSDKKMLLLVAFKQPVYERPYLTIGSNKYYLFYKGTGREGDEACTSIYTCSLPDNADLGKGINLIIDNPKLASTSSTPYNVSDGRMTVSGSIGNFPIALADEYPQVGVALHATSSLSTDFRKDLLTQVSKQIQGLSEKDAVSKLMHFIQFGFKYKTDFDQFGYEKGYFVEENFYYPYNDCEDRAILLAFLVRNLLHLDVHLLHYPGHEATAIRFTDKTVTGDSYVYNGNTYIICDPTYIGASIGQCMPQYVKTQPEVELW